MVLLDAPPSSAHALGLCADAGFTPRVRFRAGNFETARALVGRGFGWSLPVSRRPYSAGTSWSSGSGAFGSTRSK